MRFGRYREPIRSDYETDEAYEAAEAEYEWAEQNYCEAALERIYGIE